MYAVTLVELCVTAHAHTEHGREKTSECPFNLKRALWGFGRESACGMRRLYARDCPRWEQDTEWTQHRECGITLSPEPHWENFFTLFLGRITFPAEEAQLIRLKEQQQPVFLQDR